ncbi:hypothetical protein NDU88_005010 [Pleurodeles waltl]|uniref:Uncharacterized protein n=1 Tax=Pleurodeles waltl TaxID=8319 RepID=A0AAV7QE36_PLEWA|nr:hypothetical protein NDU88_005010 [Pleurodeles waltl]
MEGRGTADLPGARTNEHGPSGGVSAEPRQRSPSWGRREIGPVTEPSRLTRLELRGALEEWTRRRGPGRTSADDPELLRLEEPLEEQPHPLRPDHRQRRRGHWQTVPTENAKRDLETAIASERRAVLESLAGDMKDPNGV